MVKNKKGGSGHRKQASKNSKPIIQARIRLAKDDDETYALVVKLNGNSMCDVLCNDKEIRLLQIRKKFRGRNRRDNHIASGTMLMVGLRSWEVRKPGKKQKVDLLYVYSREQVDVLKLNSWAHKVKHIFPPDQQPEEQEDMGGFDITNTETWEDKLDEENMKLENVKVSVGDDKEEFDFDDI